MDNAFWLQKWESSEIGFHETEINPILKAVWSQLGATADSRVFVPLCGKSRDMLWLVEQGHRVVGIELSKIAIEAFFEDAGLRPEIAHVDNFEVYRTERIDIWCGDLFELPPAATRDARHVFDRASLVAMSPDNQPHYANRMAELTAFGTTTLLIALNYDQTRMDGPPFATLPAQVRAIYGHHHAVEMLAERDALPPDHRFRTRGQGLAWMNANVYRLTRQPDKVAGKKTT